MLGTLLSRLTDETSAAEMILGLGDLPLLASMRADADANGVDLATTVTQRVQHYAAEASDEEWVSLIGLLNRAQDPGASFLRRVFDRTPE